MISVESDPAETASPVGRLREYFELQRDLGHSYLRKRRPEAEGAAGRGGKGAADPPFSDIEALRQAVRFCRRCPLHRTRKQAVPGDGPAKVRLMLVGEGPGFEEDEQGRPFVGAAGQLLNRMLAAIGLSREEVYISNVVKCRPPENRYPRPEEVRACRGFLDEEIRLVDPRIVMPLGTCAAQTLMDPTKRITELRGRMRLFQGRKWIATYHPAYLLRNPGAKREAWEDLKRLKREYEQEGC
jgi:DNA polymerase